jgi:hypothetical protein
MERYLKTWIRRTILGVDRQVNFDSTVRRVRKNWSSTSGSELHNRVASEASSDARHHICEIEKKLTPLAEQAIDQVVSAARFPDFKTERLFLMNAGVCSEGPIRYRRAREAGQSASSMCSPMANLGWLASQLGDPALADEINDLAEQRADWEVARTEAQKKLNPIPISSLRSNQ